jgi:hypothetical protein
MLTDEELIMAEQYAPVLMFDKAEPFLPVRVGVTVLQRGERSPSFRREFDWSLTGLRFIIEYAIYWDYDIGHMYDLEHVWVYVGEDGGVLDGEGSFHGKYLKSVLEDRRNVEGHRIRLYSQPGKHAFSPYPELFLLLPDLRTATGKQAGTGGLLVPEMFRGRVGTDRETDALVEEYLQSCAFEPTLDYTAFPLGNSGLITGWSGLFEELPVRIGRELEKLRKKRDDGGRSLSQE